MASYHMGSSYPSSLFNTSSSSISSSFSNNSFLSNNNFGLSNEHFFSSSHSSLSTLPPLPPLPPPPLPPPHTPPGASACYPLPTYPMRGGGSITLHRNEHLQSHTHAARNGSFMFGREPPSVTSSLPGASNIMYPTNISPWPTFEPTFDITSFPTVTRPPKQKRPRMSLQKRLLVNARERERMRVLNKAFESLRDALPCYIADGHMAKITTLRLAINYIKALTDLLNDHQNHATMQQCPKTGFPFRPEQNHEELFTSIFRDSSADGLRPVFKNLEERLAICKKTKRD